MKRLLLVLFAGLLLNMHVFAQWDDYSYDDYDDDYDAYDSQPATGAAGTSNAQPKTAAADTTNITVNNMGDEDQSVQKLTLPNSQPIYLYFYNSVQNPNAPEQAAQPVEPPPPPPPKEPEPKIEYIYIPAPVPEPPPPPPPPPAPPPPPTVEYRYIQPPPSQVEYIYIQPPAPQVEYVYIQPEPSPPPPPPPPPPMQIRVIPGLPDPNSPRIFRLQVGSYAVHNTADIMAQRIRMTGLQVDIEFYNSFKRVIVPGVRAADVCTIVQILESLGFAEVWIKE
ncbi:MAG: hypothetical protein LBC52_01495 [Treponema sp.]|jgi:hypothetical protein|nr:hypothetical protein [Treponema sp.]